MPYSAAHKQKTREKIVEAARVLFNHHGFSDVTIGMIMKRAGLTHGGFYNHFDSKEQLFREAITSFLMGRGAQWRAEAGVDPACPTKDMARSMLHMYLSKAHLDDIDGQCPMIALPSDVARASPKVKQSYQDLLTAMVWLLETGVTGTTDAPRQKALALAATCVGGMVLARALPNSDLADEIREAAFQSADAMI